MKEILHWLMNFASKLDATLLKRSWRFSLTETNRKNMKVIDTFMRGNGIRA